MSLLNIYCDESCHLEHDGQPAMVLGAIWCASDYSRSIADALRELRERHGLSRYLEIKWGGVSPAHLDFYLDLVNFFFDDPRLKFRCVIAPKDALTHEVFGQDHDDWYYKMYFLLLRRLLEDRSHRYRIYLDVKDTKSGQKLRRLHDVLCNNMRDFSQEVLQQVQALHSHEVQQIQLADFLTGAVSYGARGLHQSAAKLAVLESVVARTRRPLTESTWYSESKFNIFRWDPRSPR
jgi:hypothetical protein